MSNPINWNPGANKSPNASDPKPKDPMADQPLEKGLPFKEFPMVPPPSPYKIKGA